MIPKESYMPLYIKLALIGIIPIMWLGAHIGLSKYMLGEEASWFAAATDAFNTIKTDPFGILPFCSEQLKCIGILLFFYVAICMIVLTRIKIDEVETTNTEGSNKWLTPVQVKKMVERRMDKPEEVQIEETDITDEGAKVKKKKADIKTCDSNIIYSQNVKIGMLQASENKNNSSLTIGGAGSWKTSSFIIPNVVVNYGSYVVLDPSGELFQKTATIKKAQGYVVKLINITDMNHSDFYNPFNYIHSSEDINKMVNSLIQNTDGGVEAAKHKGEDFWEKAEKNILSAVIAYLIWEQDDPAKRNYYNALILFRSATTEIKSNSNNNPNSEKTSTGFDEMFELAKKAKNSSIAGMYYDNYAVGTVKTKLSVLTSIMTRLKFVIAENTRNLLSKDTVELNMLGLRKQIIYITNKPTNVEYRWLTNIILTQIMDELLSCGEKNPAPGTVCRCPIPVKLMLEEFGSCGTLNGIADFTANCRKYGISVHMVVQNIGQMRHNYGEAYEDLIANAFVKQILSVDDNTTAKYFSEMLGYRTAKVRSRSENVSKGGVSTSDANRGRLLMQPAELQSLKRRDCVLIIGEDRVFDKKFNLHASPIKKETDEALLKYKEILPNSPIQQEKSELEKDEAKVAQHQETERRDFSQSQDAEEFVQNQKEEMQFDKAQFIDSGQNVTKTTIMPINAEEGIEEAEEIQAVNIDEYGENLY